MTDWHKEVGLRLISVENELKKYVATQRSTNESLRAMVTAIEDLTQEFYLMRGEVKKINFLLEQILEENRDMKTGVDEIYV